MISLLRLIILVSAILYCHSDNPIVQAVYTADPAPFVWNNTFYIYSGHDKDGASEDYRDNYMADWYCYSSKDMQNWENHGPVLSMTDFPWAKEGTAWAAQLVEKDGKFYFYVTVTSSARAIAVAVGDSPLGPFKDPLGKPMIGPDWYYIDPTVWIDDDGKVYMMWGNPNLCYVIMNDDMISYQGEVQKFDMKLFEGYVEGPWLYKRKDLYYLVYAGKHFTEDIRYATSDKPLGPYKYRGIIMTDEQKVQKVGSYTIHPGIVDYKGHSYFAYHNGWLPGGGSNTRSVSIEEFTYGDDGSIPEIPMTKEGPKQLEPFDPYRKVPATTICFSTGIKFEKNEGRAGIHVSNIKKGNYIKLRGVDFKEGAKKFTVSASSATDGGKIDIKLDKTDGTSVGSCEIKKTEGWQDFQTFECDVKGAEGEHDLFFVFDGGNDFLFNLDWWQFE